MQVSRYQGTRGMQRGSKTRGNGGAGVLKFRKSKGGAQKIRARGLQGCLNKKAARVVHWGSKSKGQGGCRSAQNQKGQGMVGVLKFKKHQYMGAKKTSWLPKLKEVPKTTRENGVEYPSDGQKIR